MKKFLLIAAIVFAGYLIYSGYHSSTVHKASFSISQESASKSDAMLGDAFRNHESNIQILGQGTVEKILSDDNSGKRHQRFIIKLASGQTLLIAHNIDIAQRIDGLRVGDEVQFSGEYEWNEQGGVIHWTHRDPTGRHVAGWLEHGGKRYE
jgi:hypothetical protein